MAEKKRKSEKGSVTTVSCDMEAQLEASRLENNQLQNMSTDIHLNKRHQAAKTRGLRLTKPIKKVIRKKIQISSRGKSTWTIYQLTRC